MSPSEGASQGSRAAGSGRDIRREIADRRAERVAGLGAGEGFSIPAERRYPLVPFNRESMLICEVKRSSPSRGNIAELPRAEDQARLYRSRGAGNVSVLTEPDYFSGSLQDLMDVKAACPELAVLRKDFLLTLEDIDVSYRAGADACLLIASLLDAERLQSMHRRCRELGMDALVELHSEEDIRKAAAFRPELTGINCRNLKDFKIYPLLPLKIRSLIDWDCRVVYESGVLKSSDADLALAGEFDGLLVGEGVVRNPELIGELLSRQREADARRQTPQEARRVPSESPWKRLGARWKPGRPLVKICGLTNRTDFDLAVAEGADLCGFILAPSPRQTDAAFLRSLPSVEALKVGVVVLEKDEELPSCLLRLLEEGHLDLIQYHGKESPATVSGLPGKSAAESSASPAPEGRGYKALRIRSEEDLRRMDDFYPRPCLLDAFVKGQAGGTGRQIDEALVEKARGLGELWLAGGLNPDNVGELVKNYSPELIDASSGLEAEPGRKDPDKVRAFFKEIANHAQVQ